MRLNPPNLCEIEFIGPVEPGVRYVAIPRDDYSVLVERHGHRPDAELQTPPPQGGPGVPPKPDYADALEKMRDAAMALAAVYQRMAAAVRKGGGMSKELERAIGAGWLDGCGAKNDGVVVTGGTMSKHEERQTYYVYQPFGSVTHPKLAESGHLWGVGCPDGLGCHETVMRGLTKAEAQAIAHTLNRMHGLRQRSPVEPDPSVQPPPFVEIDRW